MNGFHSPNGKGDTQDGVSEPSVSTGTPPKKHNLKDLKSFRKGRLNMRNSPSSKFESDSTSIMSPASDSVRTVPETPEFPHVTKQEGIFRMDDKDHDDSSPESPFFCKKKRRIIFESDGESSDGERPEKSPTSHLTSHYTVNEDSGEERDIITRKGTKRKPLLSDSSDEEERHKE
ncbi:unnamed protein product [Darwinula stevensoni]|uniref:Uncharacterized protein n=1 Tax=Darwinula stevensoni TaxID=69355 RepID=A0A7R9FPZ6_9CRUS|nr:unnamed protein product [Darwinula stevensoni]CAG0898803.1 unnamed protein product [Darwinula stevensoni]